MEAGDWPFDGHRRVYLWGCVRGIVVYWPLLVGIEFLGRDAIIEPASVANCGFPE